MHAADIVRRAREQGVYLDTEKGNLTFKLTVEVFPVALKSLIKENKADIIDFITGLKSKEQNIPIKKSEIVRQIRCSSELQPVSFAQQRLWFIDSLQRGSPEYNMPMAFEVEGELDIALVTDVFNTILARHEVLRTVYVEKSGETLQHIRSMSAVGFDIKVENLSHLTGERLEGQIKHLVAMDIISPFNLAKDLMLRVSYVKKTANVGVIIFNMHHIASDGWSMEILIKEFFTLYCAYSQGLENPLPELDIQYVDYAHWQREFLSGEVLESQLSYWEKQLAELPAVHGLTLDHTRPAIKQHQGAVVKGELPAKTAKQLLIVAKAHKLTPFMLLHGALSLLLSRHSNSADIVVGTPMANRLLAELKPLIGFFANTLVLRVNTIHDTLSDYFAHIRQVHLDAQSNQDVPFEQLVERLKAPRSTAYSPLFQVMMTTNADYGVNEGDDIASFPLSGVNVKTYQSDIVQAKFDLNIDLSISEQGVSLNWNYDTNLFTEEHIIQFNEHLSRLLEGLCHTQGKASQALNTLPMLSAGEIQHLMHELNDTTMDYPRDKCIHVLFEQQAAANPDHVAVVFEDKQLTYRQLNETANQLAHYLKEKHDITPDTLVGLCVERSLEMVIGILAILKAGGCYVPLDIEHGTQILNARLSAHNVTTTLLSESTKGVLENESIARLNINEILLKSASNYSKENLCVQISSESLAYAMSSSGTTGKPKLIGLPHKALNNLISSITTEHSVIKGPHRVLQFASVGFDMSFTDIALALLQGGCSYLITENTRFDVTVLTDLIKRHEISLLNLPFSMLQVISEICVDHQMNLPSLSVIISGAEQFNISEKLKEFIYLNERIRLVNHYGPTETNGCTTYNLDDSPKKWALEVPIGKPIGNTQCYILDGNKSLVPKGATGELYVGGDCLAVGYLGNTELTKEKFIKLELPNIGITRLYRTGDLVKWEKDQLIYAGRIDEQLKINGYRVELEDVKQQIKMHPEIHNATVVHDPKFNHLIGYYSSDTIDEAEVRAYLIDHIPIYMLPKYFVRVDEFKLTINGKIDKRSLPVFSENHLQSMYVAPNTTVEIEISKIWSNLLDILEDEISSTSSFFDLGGSSIQLIKVLHRIQESFGIEITVEKLYHYQDLSSLGRFIEEEVSLIKMTRFQITKIEDEEAQWEI